MVNSQKSEKIQEERTIFFLKRKLQKNKTHASNKLGVNLGKTISLETLGEEHSHQPNCTVHITVGKSDTNPKS